MDSKKAYEMMQEEYVEREALELCNQMERQLERIITYNTGMLNEKTFNQIKAQAIKLLKEWHLQSLIDSQTSKLIRAMNGWNG